MYSGETPARGKASSGVGCNKWIRAVSIGGEELQRECRRESQGYMESEGSRIDNLELRMDEARKQMDAMMQLMRDAFAEQ